MLSFSKKLDNHVSAIWNFIHEGNGVTLEMAMIPGGTFIMGSPDSEASRNRNEGPQREVKISAFAMGKYEVTQAQWKAVMEQPRNGSARLRVATLAQTPQKEGIEFNNPSKFKGDNRPVENVTWNVQCPSLVHSL